MKKLEDIPKKQIFAVPEGYFEKLPSKIQDKIISPRVNHVSFFWRWRLQYAVPLLAIATLIIFLLKPSPATISPEEMLASVSTEELISYLDETELSSDEIFAIIEFSDTDAEEIENEAFQFQINDLMLEDLNELNQDTL
ncbi:hypothetical protein [Chryseosolibacter indicus]|uniref:Uncharacterized protein n=1 Tax=Chryseosolibacter indicus TaxID=2782351 RepID=A0ABS5VJN7_9BACT|nr:hypothetical protein [Chryseosolibacter indicus]MBT1701667.1 hypothetical protein [Chryseosolibacter indicus]